MNKKFVLTLLSSPVLFSSILSIVMMTQPAHASQTGTPPGSRVSCLGDPQTATPRFACQRVSNSSATQAKPATKVAPVQSNEITELEFTEQESDEAIRLFGCDCPPCINAVRKINGLSPMAS
ncbi:hypothetical protein H6G81_27835 [Scytonema hofmannii FACHB-248]|uniref:Secreted protein n=1 Tax=Scytonema hofmannii FACHB-248 TaxID=1842502 RepID=A0ABR8GXJ7_9CYAN|nr:MULTISPECIES: hypothetical protein [Nostocales]MBD2608222.1 hypothetical protein [Scytonema hofmannii FACHB-248]